ncbi:histidine phosphatase family protein [Pedobacter sp. SYSU D00535]|uniref:SixA phosphatase family protein n=1 Tax=Pedobacter sp. SYSU D00535 TaxID=2810308 RepID=UPI001A961588|nr:histidine phosphatase family protein [Pedobacter sp. SYSU D00535]
MKQILLVRHAKSDWENPQQPDFERPLNKRGQANAPEMAKRLLKKHLIPQHLVSSPAVRAITTAKYFADILGFSEKEIQREQKIYEASASDLLEVLNKLDNKHDFVALFGHNPGLTTLAVSLSDSDIYNIPTCGMLLIEFPFDDWSLISYGTGVKKMYDFPKNPEENQASL